MIPHFRTASAAEWAAWASVTDLGQTRPATAAELLNRGAVVEHVAADGTVYFHAAGAGPWPGEPLSDPAAIGQRERYRSVPAGDKAAVYQAEVVRCLDGSDLRGECCAVAGAVLPAYTPAAGAGEDAAAVLEEARARAAAGDAVVVRVPMVEVVEADVVVQASVRGVRFAGEPE